jgi:ubiquinone/menaquinone biosynthesis C-methylase UbiE
MVKTIKKIRYVWKFAYRHLFFKAWYRVISILDKKSEVLFMNFGYHNNEHVLNLLPEEQINRYSIHLYHQLVHKHQLTGKKILEVGCGRGGGLAYVKRQFAPALAIGLDLDSKAVKFCRKHHPSEGLEFVAGNAHQLPFEDNSFDFVINVESSHRYENIGQFLNEVHRVLRPGGFFLITDFRREFLVDKLDRDLAASKLTVAVREDITPNVTEALERDDARRKELINRIAPFFLKKLALEFAGIKDSDVYRNFESGRWVYLNYFLQKDYNS